MTEVCVYERACVRLCLVSVGGSGSGTYASIGGRFRVSRAMPPKKSSIDFLAASSLVDGWIGYCAFRDRYLEELGLCPPPATSGPAPPG